MIGKDVKSEWESFRRVLPKDAPLLQVLELQRAFYAGATAMFALLLRATDEVDEADAEAELNALKDELQAFAARIGKPDEVSPRLRAVAPEIAWAKQEAQFEVKDPDMQQMLRTLGRQIKRGMPPEWGFTLFLFTLDDRDGGSMFYLSSAERTSMLEALHEFIARQIPSKGAH